MIRWEEIGEYEGIVIYKRIDEDGLVRVTAVKGYPELDAYLAQSLPSDNLSE
jgi:hypothetical protein